MKKTQKKDKTEKKNETADMKTKLAVCCVAGLIVLAAIIFGIIFLYRSIFTENPRFTITKIMVNSNGYWNNRTADLIKVTGLKVNSDNIWKLSLSNLREKALKLEGVENCDVIRIIPNTIEFAITERIPRAQLSEYPSVLVDSGTFAIPKSKAMPNTGKLPYIMGMPKKMKFIANKKIPQLDFAMFLIMKTIRDFSEFEIVAIDIANPDYYTLWLRYNGGAIKRVIIPVDHKNIDIKFIALRTAMSQAAIKNIEYKLFDLSFKDRVVCQ